MTSRLCNYGTNSVSVSQSFGLHVIMGTQSSGDQLFSFDSNAEFTFVECLEKYTENERDYVRFYSEDINAGISAGLVMRIYRIVPHMHSVVFSTLYMYKKNPQLKYY
jgi:hypothetical protein